MRASIISFLFTFVLFATANAMNTIDIHLINSTLTDSTNPWILKDLYEGQIIELGEIEFEMDESVLNENSKKSLKTLGEFLNANESVKIEIGGHTNSIPPHEYCDKLSESRAQSVRQYLISLGVNSDNIEAKGYGKRHSKYSNYTSTGRKSNQRVEVIILAL